MRKVKFSKRADFCLKKCDWIAESLVVEPRPASTAELLTKQILRCESLIARDDVIDSCCKASKRNQ